VLGEGHLLSHGSSIYWQRGTSEVEIVYAAVVHVASCDPKKVKDRGEGK